ncbi:hypothetical protein CK203_060267 [Vitis vinifera]|uniref:UBN2 domain-containing protein n=1 Tax=Vitis vinifera TaxID=29760 RepID=A0A438GLM0_VITVI|nr:hypothetical protein CK203_060267 [Vitis vinifera]
MKDNETIVEMITRFTDIVNGLKALRKTYKELEKVMKILRSLPSKWDAKATAIQEAKDLIKLPLEELIRPLMTYEITLAKKQQEGEDKNKKSIAFKATTKKEEVEEKKKVKKMKTKPSSQESSTSSQGVKSLEEEDSLLEETPLKRNLHPMVTRDEMRKETWCALSARNQDTLNMIVLSTKVKPRGEIGR